MRMPSGNKTGLAKGVTVFATILLVSAGLCGANLALFSRFGAVSGPEQPNGRSEFALLLIYAAVAELLGMAVGLIGLIIIALATLEVVIRRKIAANQKKSEE